MESRAWHVAFAGAGLIALTLAASSRLSRERDRPSLLPSVQLSGPVVDAPAEMARLKAKHRIALEVLEGRTSLLAAAAAFRRLNDNLPPWVRRPDCLIDGASEDEDYCRFVIAWVRSEAPPASADGLTNRLRAELDAMLRDGTLHLSDSENASPAGEGVVPISPSTAPLGI